ncbi:MAG: hypothetical protein V4858_14170 [Pseudomonadota bacterium]
MKSHTFRLGLSCIVLLCIGLLAQVLGAIIVRHPAAWSLVPMWPTDVLMSAVQPTSQETASDLEFLGIWVVCFCAIGSGWVATVVLWKLYQYGRASEHVV